VEQKGLNGDDTIYFRGGNYTISQNNYYPDERLDRRQITFADALGKSINPAFARVALNNLTSSSLERFAHAYLFNQNIPFDVPIEVSQFVRPETDYEIARTAAGFGPVTLSPLHAALITAAIANKGTMMRPYFIEKVTSEDGKLKYSATPYPIKVSVLSSTAKELLQMMEATVESGTARKQFIKLTNPFLLNNSIAAKTGTLSNTNPKGICHWFVVAAPVEDPEIVMSVLIVDPGYVRIKSSFIAKELLEYYFRDRDILGRSAIPITLEFPASSSVGVG
ncbi:MAG: penicillin-binding protein, partial [Proteobacteria bacterium]|nr:penicillin-binding protein [Pseudomonadota bacterium]